MKKQSDSYAKILNDAKKKGFSSATDSMKWYLDQIKNLRIKKYEPSKQSSNPKSLLNNLMLLNYNPKEGHKIHEANPLVYTFAAVPDGVIGYNFHHLPHGHRAALFDSLFGDERLVGSAFAKLTKDVTKKYLFKNIAGLQVVPQEQWHLALFLPVEKFQRNPKPMK